jgi:5,6-dimethylbenzimidazole synthase
MKFSKKQAKTLQQIIRWRRDVRGNNFTNQKIKKKILHKILASALSAPSVGYSQPWRFVIIKDNETKVKIHTLFTQQFEKSKLKFQDRPLYATLKLEGIIEAPINIAVLYQKPKKEILGQTYMKRSGEYSVVCAIENMWLTARSLNVGMGWVSILKPKKVKKILNISNEYKLVGYFCLGHTKESLHSPELEKLGWEKKKNIKKCIL